MRITKELLAALKRRERKQEVIVHYIAAGEASIIGYRLLENRPPQEKLIAKGVQFFQVGNPKNAVTTSCSLQRVGGKGSRLYAIVTIQGEGLVRYQWVDHEGTAHNVYVFASPPGEDVDVAIRETANYFKRIGIIWRVANRAGTTLVAAKATLDKVRKLAYAYEALELAKYAKENNATEALRVLQSLRDSADKRPLLKIIAKLNIRRDPSTTALIVRGAIAALSAEQTQATDE